MSGPEMDDIRLAYDVSTHDATVSTVTDNACSCCTPSAEFSNHMHTSLVHTNTLVDGCLVASWHL